MLTFNDSLTQIIFIALILYLQVVHVMLSLLFCKEQLHWFGPIIIVKLINVSQTFLSCLCFQVLQAINITLKRILLSAKKWKCSHFTLLTLNIFPSRIFPYYKHVIWNEWSFALRITKVRWNGKSHIDITLNEP